MVVADINVEAGACSTSQLWLPFAERAQANTCITPVCTAGEAVAKEINDLYGDDRAVFCPVNVKNVRG